MEYTLAIRPRQLRSKRTIPWQLELDSYVQSGQYLGIKLDLTASLCISLLKCVALLISIPF